MLVSSYLTVSPLPRLRQAETEAVCFLLHFPWNHFRWGLPSTLPCGVRTFLDRPEAGRDRLVDSAR
jgi:hypothetical protein